MAFPDYKKGWFSDKLDGWEDRGEVETRTVTKNGKFMYESWVCGRCRSTAHIGREKGKPFSFCPKCLVVLSDRA